jgi:uncharacterized membrane protein
MIALVLLALIVVVFLAGAIAGAILLVSLASVREDRRPLNRRPANRMARAGRFVTGLQVDNLPRVPSGARRRRPEPAARSAGPSGYPSAPDDAR